MTQDESQEPVSDDIASILACRDMLDAKPVPPQRTEQEPVELPCCGYTDASAIKWNSFNGVVQCHNCGQTYTPPAPQRTEQEPVAVYGYCHECGAKGVQRERRPNGNDKCANGHTYPSSKAAQPAQRTEQNFCSRCGKRTKDSTHIHTCTPPQD